MSGIMAILGSIASIVMAIPKIWAIFLSIKESVEKLQKEAQAKELAKAVEAYKGATDAKSQDDAFKDIIKNS